MKLENELDYYLNTFIAGLNRKLPLKISQKIHKILEKEAKKKEVDEIPANVISKIKKALESGLENFKPEDFKIDDLGEDMFSIDQGDNDYVHFKDNEPKEKNYEILIESPYFMTQTIIIGFKFIGEDLDFDAKLDYFYVRNSNRKLNQRIF